MQNILKHRDQNDYVISKYHTYIIWTMENVSRYKRIIQ